MTVAAKKRAMTVSVIYDADDDMMMIGLVDHCDIVSDSVLIGAAQRHGVDELTQESIQCTLAAEVEVLVGGISIIIIMVVARWERSAGTAMKSQTPAPRMVHQHAMVS